MNRLLTDKEMIAALNRDHLWDVRPQTREESINLLSAGLPVLCKAQDAKTRAETLKECARWLRDEKGNLLWLPKCWSALDLMEQGKTPWIEQGRL